MACVFGWRVSALPDIRQRYDTAGSLLPPQLGLWVESCLHSWVEQLVEVLEGVGDDRRRSAAGGLSLGYACCRHCWGGPPGKVRAFLGCWGEQLVEEGVGKVGGRGRNDRVLALEEHEADLCHVTGCKELGFGHVLLVDRVCMHTHSPVTLYSPATHSTISMSILSSPMSDARWRHAIVFRSN